MSTQIRLAVFDCDGTLVDSQHAIITCMQAAFDYERLPRPNDNQIRSIVGLPLDVGISRLQPGLPEQIIERIRNGYRAEWEKLKISAELQEPLYPGAVTVLEELKVRGWRLGIATGKSYRGLIHTLKMHHILDHFITLQTADRARGKPDPEMLMNAMVEIKASPTATVMIGDTTFDMEMAQTAGISAIGVNWGYHNCLDLKKSGAYRVINSFSALPDLLDFIIKV